MDNTTKTRIFRPFQMLCGLAILAPCIATAQAPPANSVGALPGSVQPQLNPWELRAQQDDQLYIPPAADRPLGEDAGPRIQVTALALDIDARLESQIDAQTSDSLNLMLNSRVFDGVGEGLTIGRLENIAADVTDLLRSAGFILAWAYLPEQNVDNGTVTIAVLPGNLDNIEVDGNNDYSVSRLLVPFTDLLGVPVQRSSIENSILQLRSYPGLSTSAVFSAGDAIGTSKLTLRVSEDPFDIGFVADNHGTESTGENRVRSDLFWYNPFGRADLLSINVLQTFQPAENLYGALNYQTPIFGKGMSLGLSYSNNAFEIAEGIGAGVAVGGGNLTGDTNIGSISLGKNLRLARRSRADLSFDLSVKNATLEGLGKETEDNLTVVSLNFSAESVDGIFAGGINQLQLRYAQGISEFLGSMSDDGDGGQSTRTGGNGQSAGGNFGKFTLRYQRLQRISENNSLLFRAEGQHSDDLLTSLEQVVLGGPNSVRAYPIAEYLADTGAFGSVEWIIDVASAVGGGGGNNSFSISAFADYAYGRLNRPLANEIDDTDLSGWGVGLSYGRSSNSGNQFQIRVDVATPITDVLPSDGDDPQIYGQVSFTFR